MSRLERVLVCSTSVAVLWLAVSSVVPCRHGTAPVVHAADSDDNAALDVVRRGLGFAQGSATAERERAVSLAGSRYSLGTLRGEIDHALSVFKSERERYERLDKSSGKGDRQLGQDALKRSMDWLKVENTLRAAYLAELERTAKLAGEDRDRAKKALERSEEWRKAETLLLDAFYAEAQRVKAAAGAAKAK